jgi:chemotaxis protein CheD
VAVAIYCPKTRCGGILHYVLPHSSIDSERALLTPAVFANTGLPQLLQNILAIGVNPRRAKVWMAGGATTAPSSDFFGMGERNLTAARAWLWKEGLAWESVGCGGIISRDLYLELDTGMVGVHRFQNPGGGHAL